MEFSDRYTSLYSGLNLTTLDTLTDEQFKNSFPKLHNAVMSVRRHSVLLSKKSRVEIYYAITEHADPKIGLILAAARDKEGNQLFPTTSYVKEFMFSITSTDSANSNVAFAERTVFVDGIERVAIAMAASLLIGQLAQLKEQQDHSVYIESQAIKDLDRILQVPELAQLVNTQSKKLVDEVEFKSFYFEPKEVKLNEPLTMEVFITGSQNIWNVVEIYTDTVSTDTIISDLCDYINSFTLQANLSNLVASAVLAAEKNLHRIDFSSRQRSIDITYELISVRFSSALLGFNWGVKSDELKEYKLNSLILTTLQGKVATSTVAKLDDRGLSVMYFRVKLGVVPITNTITYRISPTMTENKVLTMPAVNTLYNLTDRESIVSATLLNDLFQAKDLTKVLASIVQNDPSNNAIQYSAIELIAYSAAYPESELILDVLQLPEDIEIALGNKYAPVTTFSNKPRSITVKTVLDRNLANLNLSVNGIETPPLLATAKKPKILERLNDIRDAERISYSRLRQVYNNPPNIYSPYFNDKNNL